jgi:TM2 domain-containing membrane protein YozV
MLIPITSTHVDTLYQLYRYIHRTYIYASSSSHHLYRRTSCSNQVHTSYIQACILLLTPTYIDARLVPIRYIHRTYTHVSSSSHQLYRRTSCSNQVHILYIHACILLLIPIISTHVVPIRYVHRTYTHVTSSSYHLYRRTSCSNQVRTSYIHACNLLLIPLISTHVVPIRYIHRTY